MPGFIKQDSDYPNEETRSDSDRDNTAYCTHPVSGTIGIERVSLTLPLALAALAILIPGIIAWGISYYRISDNANQIRENKDTIKLASEKATTNIDQLEDKIRLELAKIIAKQALDSADIKVLGSSINSIGQTLSYMREDQKRIENKLDTVLDK